MLHIPGQCFIFQCSCYFCYFKLVNVYFSEGLDYENRKPGEERDKSKELQRTPAEEFNLRR